MSFDQFKQTKVASRRSAIADLYSTPFDIISDKTTQRFMILATPRSGSTLLAVHLAKTGLLGLPLEYLNLDHLRFKGIKTERQVTEFLDELERRRTTPNGVFGVKLFSHFAKQIEEEMPLLFNHLFKSYHVIHVLRRDRVAQAISDVRARQTGRWFSDQEEAKEPEYSYQAIKSAVRRIRNNERWCRDTLEDLGINPVIVHYEDFVQNPSNILQAIKNRIAGMVLEGAEVTKLPNLSIQRDEISEQWKLRFKADRAESSAER